MNSDPNYQRWREIAWRRPLTETERAEFQAWLATHPEAQPEAELDAALDRALACPAAPPAASNFTARVLQAIERDLAPAGRPQMAGRWWHGFLPKVSVAAVVLVLAGLGYQHQRAVRLAELTAAAQQLANARPLSNPAVIDDFEVIRGLSPMLAVADESLLDLSDDLLALGNEK